MCGNALGHRRPESPDGSQFKTVPLSTTGRSTGMQQNTPRAADRSNRSALAWIEWSPRPQLIRRAYTAQSDTLRSEDMGIPPLRYAVQTGSDVSLGSSVPPDCSRGPEHRPCNETHLVTDSCQGIVPANPQLALRVSWTHSG